MIRIFYVLLRCTNPDPDGTVTQQDGNSPDSTRLFRFLKSAIFVINLCIYQYKSTFPKIRAVTESEDDNVIEFV